MVALQLWVRAGSADEAPEDAGLAHVHEHMLFKGTARRPPGRIARDVESRGGTINAWTSFDETVYHLVLASRHLDDGLDVLADAVREASFDPAELGREIEVIAEEIRRANDLPSRRTYRALYELAYQRHPYRRPVIGTEASVRAFTRERVLDYYRRHYVPQRLTLIAAGDFDAESVRPLVERRFGGDWGRAAGEAAPRQAEPPQGVPRARVAAEEVAEGYFAAAWHIAGVGDADAPALDLLAVILGQGDSSRLPLRVKREQMLANDVGASAFMPRDPGLLLAGGTAPPEKTGAALEATLAEVYRLAREPVAEADLAAAKAIVESDSVYQRETVQGMARKLGFFQVVAGALEYEARYYERIATLTREDLVEAARRCLRPENTSVSARVPRGVDLTEAEVFSRVARAAAAPAVLPAGGASPSSPQGPNEVGVPRAPPVRLRASPRAVRAAGAGLVRARLGPAVTALVKPEAAVPLVAVHAAYPGGLRAEDAASNGITQLLARALSRGAGGSSAESISRAVDEMAGSLSGVSGRNSFGARMEFLSRHLERGLSLFVDCLLRPDLHDSEVARERALQVQEIRSRDDNPAGVAGDLFARTLFRVHPYRLDVLGEEPSVSALTARDLRALHERYARHTPLTVVVAGDADPDEVMALLERHLGGASSDPAEGRAVPVEPPPDSPRRAVRVLDRQQAHLVLGFRGTTVTAPDRHAMEVLATVLSGQGGRLFQELRDRRSLAYSVTAYAVEGVDPGYFAVYLATAPEKIEAAIEGIRAELLRVRQERVSDEELARAKQYLIGIQAIGLQRNAARAAVITYDAACGAGAEAYREYPERIAAVDADEVHAVAQRYLRPEGEALAVVGPDTAGVRGQTVSEASRRETSRPHPTDR